MCYMFAYNSNKNHKKFYSKILSLGCSEINAFSMDWSGDFNRVGPPVKDVVYILEHMKSKSTEGILVKSMWPSAVFWNKITMVGISSRWYIDQVSCSD